ncbi:MAG TPA: hypothetical protein VGK99_18705 [Acidobacteriota bacterium]|jgi:hypothetical protein
MRAKYSLIIALVFSLISVKGLAQATPEAEAAVKKIKAAEKVTRVYEVKSRDAVELAGLLEGFQARIVANSSFNTVTVTAVEEDQGVIAGLIRRFDTPQRMIDLQFYVVRASKGGTGIKDGVPPNIRKVIEELASLTRYDSFELVDSPVIRVDEGRVEAESSGKVKISVRFPRVISADQKRQIAVGNFSCSLWFPEKNIDGKVMREQRVNELRSSFTVADGETIVLGSSRLGGGASGSANDDAIVTVVTGKVLK